MPRRHRRRRVPAAALEPLFDAILAHQDTAVVRHADETSWRVQELGGEDRSNRAWLWTSVSDDAVCFHIDASRSAEAAEKLFAGIVLHAVIVCDRYSAYKKLARMLTGLVTLAFCWRYVTHAIMLLSGSFAAPDMMNLHCLRNIICCIHSVPRKAISPLFAFHGRSGPGSAASQSAITLAFISISIRAWLGHVSLDTTNIHAEIDLDTKAQAIALCEAVEAGPRRPWKDKPALMSFLKSL